MTAAALREHGIARSYDRAERVVTAWGVLAYGALLVYACDHREFTSEQASAAAYATGLPQPPDKRAMGRVYQRAVKVGIIRKSPLAGMSEERRSPCPLWISNVYGGNA